jgi:hypothetical protein
MSKSKPEPWLHPGEIRGWACDNCSRTGRGRPAELHCAWCQSRELYRVALTPCPQFGRECRDLQHRILVDGSVMHARIG